MTGTIHKKMSWTTKSQNGTFREQIMSRYLNSYLTKIRIFFCVKIASASADLLKSIINSLSTMDLCQSCFRCSRLRLTRRLSHLIGIGKIFFSFVRNNAVLGVNTTWRTISKKLGISL